MGSDMVFADASGEVLVSGFEFMLMVRNGYELVGTRLLPPVPLLPTYQRSRVKLGVPGNGLEP